MDRAELEGLDRDALIVKAEAAGVARARILTRPELIDELLVRDARFRDRSALQRSRGFFGRARDLLARVVERGLHLPDAADRIRAARVPEPVPVRAPASALPTVTLAEIYATQGHRDRAVETLHRVMAREPDHAAARALLSRLEDASYVAPAPPLPPEDEAPVQLEQAHSSLPSSSAPTVAPRSEPAVAAEPPPDEDAVDECVALPVGDGAFFVCWSVSEGMLAHLRAARSGGALVLRVLIVVPTWDGPRASARDYALEAPSGDVLVRDLPRDAAVRAAVGWRTEDAFVPIAQSPALEAPSSDALGSAEVLVRWTPKGARTVSPDDADAASITRAMEMARRRASLGIPFVAAMALLPCLR